MPADWAISGGAHKTAASAPMPAHLPICRSPHRYKGFRIVTVRSQGSSDSIRKRLRDLGLSGWPGRYGGVRRVAWPPLWGGPAAACVPSSSNPDVVCDTLPRGRGKVSRMVSNVSRRARGDISWKPRRTEVAMKLAFSEMLWLRRIAALYRLKLLLSRDGTNEHLQGP